MPDRKVAIVDDEADVRLPLRRFLLGKGYAVLEADSVAALRSALRQESVDAAVVDFSLPDGDGLDVLRTIKAQDPTVPVVLLTGHGSIDLAVKAIKEGVKDGDKVKMMPAEKLTDDEIKALVAFVRGLKK